MMKYDTDRPSPVPWPLSFGGKERFECTFAHVFAHADAVVFHLDFCPRRVEAGAQDNAPRLAVVFAQVNGLGGVLQQVEQHLLQFVGSAGHRAQLRIELGG